MKTFPSPHQFQPHGMDVQDRVYTVEIDNRGCSNCGKEAGYTVVGPDGVEECAVYNDRAVAEEIADLMNAAYEQGRRHAVRAA